MPSISYKHPLVFGALLFFVALLAAVPIMILLQTAGQSVDVSSAIARLVVAVGVAFVCRDAIHWDKSFSGLVLAIPALGFVVWNLIFNTLGGCHLVGLSEIPAAIVMGVAPGMLEELVFRGATIEALRRSGSSNMRTLIMSSVLFAVVHLTNFAGMEPVSVIVQTGYALVIGLVFGAMYLASDDIATVILVHAAIDIASRIFASHPTTTSTPAIVVFVVLLAAEAAYAFWLMRQAESSRAIR